MTEMMICDRPIPFHLIFSISDYYNDYNDYHYDEFNSWLATMMNDLSYHNLIVKDATELALDRPLWRLLAASGAMH